MAASLPPIFSERFLEVLLDSATDHAIIGMDLESRVIVWNEGATRILGWTKEEMRGRAAHVFFTPEDCEAHIPQKEMAKALGEGKASDERWHVRKDGRRFWASGEITPLMEQGQAQGFLKILRDRTEYRLLQERQTFLMRELAHRMKNTLAVVQAISASTFRGDISLAEAKAAFNARILALAKAHDLLLQGNWTGANLRALVTAAVGAVTKAEPPAFLAAGPGIALGPDAASAFALLVHELATNAAKYGAFSTPSGSVAATWRIVGEGEQSRLAFQWQERGGPPVKPPAKRGVGSLLIEQSFNKRPGDIIALTYRREGVAFELDLPLSRLEQGPQPEAESAALLSNA